MECNYNKSNSRIFQEINICDKIGHLTLGFVDDIKIHLSDKELIE